MMMTRVTDITTTDADADTTTTIITTINKNNNSIIMYLHANYGVSTKRNWSTKQKQE
jgi:hypothetical protein